MDIDVFENPAKYMKSGKSEKERNIVSGDQENVILGL